MIYISSIQILWIVFLFLVSIIFVIDNYIYNKKNIIKTSLKNYYFCQFYWFFLSLFFILIFWLLVYKNQGGSVATSKIILFFTGYLLEILLSIDNVFVWFLIFKSLKTPIFLQKKVLLYGVWSAFILRFIVIFYGKILFYKWHWFLYFFGILLFFASLKTFFLKNNSKKKKVKILHIPNIFRVTKNINDKRFFFIENKRFFFTPLFLALITVEFSDILFSVDSIPAIFSITDDFFIILTSNIFSILGLRSMYFFLSFIIEKNIIIEYGLSIILMFIGLKILLEKFFVISTFFTLCVILIILFATFVINTILHYKKN